MQISVTICSKCLHLIIFKVAINSNSDDGQYRRTENIHQFNAVFFVGTRLQYDSLVPSGFRDISELRVRVEVYYLWLNA